MLMHPLTLPRSIQILSFLFLLFGGLYFAQSFLIPLAFAGILGMLFIPVCHWFEKRKIHRGWACIFCVFCVLVLISAIFTVISWQVSDLAGNADLIKQKVGRFIEKVELFITDRLDIPKAKQDEILRQQQNSGTQNAAAMVAGFFNGIMGLLIDFILVLVYMFLFLYFRTHLKRFAIMLAGSEKRNKTSSILHDCAHVAQQYLAGLSLMIVILWIMYGIGFSIVGVKNAVLFAVLCGLLEIVPFIGNITGTVLTILFSVAQGAGGGVVMGILITYSLVQFIQTYLLEPLVVGSEVNINPLFTIIILVLGELLWGIPGMVLAIPILGIIKIICDNVDSLKPYGFLIGENKRKGKHSSYTERIRKWFTRSPANFGHKN